MEMKNELSTKFMSLGCKEESMYWNLTLNVWFEGILNQRNRAEINMSLFIERRNETLKSQAIVMPIRLNGRIQAFATLLVPKVS